MATINKLSFIGKASNPAALRPFTKTLSLGANSHLSVPSSTRSLPLLDFSRTSALSLFGKERIADKLSFAKKMLTAPLTNNVSTTSKFIWASTIAVICSLEATFFSLTMDPLISLYQAGCYFSFTSYLMGLVQVSSLAIGMTAAPVLHGIRSLFSSDPAAPEVDSEALPSVTIQVPSRNEPFEVLTQRSLATALAVRRIYPEGKLNIQMVDNSETGQFEDVRAFCEENNIQFVHREGLEGGKSGNLNMGLKEIDTDYVFIMDADIKLEPDSLNKVMGEFVQDPKLGFAVIEAKTKNLAGDNHIFARALEKIHNFSSPLVQAFDDCGLVPLAGYSTAINTQYLRKVGGWSVKNVGEDYECGIKMACELGVKGKRVSYVRAEDPALISLDRWKTQQYRWAFGTVQTLRAWTLPILKSKDLTWDEKASILFRLMYYPTMALPFTIFGIINAPLHVAALSENADAATSAVPFWRPFFWSMLLVLPMILAIKNALSKDKSGIKNGFLNFYSGLFIGSGILLEVTRAVTNAIISGEDYFRVTPKGKLQEESIWSVFQKNKWEMMLGATFLSAGILNPVMSWFALIGAGCIAVPFISWRSNKTN